MAPTDNPHQLVVYGHDWCSLATALRRELQAHTIPHEWRDVQRGDPRFQEELRALANDNLSVPTVVFPNGKVLVEPYPKEVLARLGVGASGIFGRLWARLRGV